MRKSSYFRISHAKDEQAYSLLLNCRHCTHNQLREYVSDNRIKNYLNAKMIEPVHIQDKTVYRLTDKGYKDFGNALIVENYRYHSNAIEHDIALSDRYIAVHREQPNCQWRNEEDLKHDRRAAAEQLREKGRYEAAERLMNTSVPDCKVTSSTGITTCYEIVTDNYTQMDISEKYDFTMEMNIDYFEYERI